MFSELVLIVSITLLVMYVVPAWRRGVFSLGTLLLIASWQIHVSLCIVILIWMVVAVRAAMMWLACRHCWMWPLHFRVWCAAQALRLAFWLVVPPSWRRDRRWVILLESDADQIPTMTQAIAAWNSIEPHDRRPRWCSATQVGRRLRRDGNIWYLW